MFKPQVNKKQSPATLHVRSAFLLLLMEGVQSWCILMMVEPWHAKVDMAQMPESNVCGLREQVMCRVVEVASYVAT